MQFGAVAALVDPVTDRRIEPMHRTHILARELRGAVVVVLVAVLIAWLFAKLNDDRAEAKAQRDLGRTTTTMVTTTTVTTTTAVDNDERLCSIASAFRDDLAALSVQLVSPSGADRSGALPIDIGFAPSEDEAPTADAPPRIVDPERIDPVASGLLGEPQRVAFDFYSAASTLRLGLIDADFDAATDYLGDFIAVAETYGWNPAEITASNLNDRWTALTTQPPVGVENSLGYVDEQCGIRIGPGFVYREPAPDLPILDQVLVPTEIDPSVDPAARRRPPPPDE